VIQNGCLIFRKGNRSEVSLGIYKQAPVRDFLYAGMENTSATLFNTRYVVDSTGFEDRSYTNVNAHELAHQWFGNLVTAESGKHHWLQEGFATYYALLAEKEIYGEDHFYSKLYESASQLKFASRTDTIPVLNAKPVH
jgi:aminopeptidase N